MRKLLTKTFGSSFSVTVVPTLKDNFSYLITDHHSGDIAAVDVNADVEPLLRHLEASSQLDSTTHHLHTILTTHKHADHSGGNLKLRSLMTTKHHAHGAITPDSFVIVGGAKENIPGATRNVVDGDRFNVGHLSVEVMDSPCHTTGHVMYKIAHSQHPEDGMAIFTGDTIFMAGVGAFFEGNSEDMCAVMRRMFFLHGDAAAIEDARTFIFPGHEYTAGFLRFSERIFPDKSSTDVAFIQACAARTAAAVAEGLPSIPSTLAEEKRINMFMRVADPSFRQLMKQPKEVELMDYLYNACD